MHLLIFALIAIFSITYLIVWIRSKIQPVRKDGTMRQVGAEAFKLSLQLLLLTIAVGISYGAWYLYDDNQSEKITESNITAKWRSDEFILNLHDDNTFEYDAYAGVNKDKKWTGSWNLDGGVLFLKYENNPITDNYRVEAVDKDDLKLVLKTTEGGQENTSTFYFDKVE